MNQLTERQQSIDASIELPNAQLSYRPGDIVSGIIKKVQIEDNPEIVSCGIRLVCQIKLLLSTSSTDGDGKSSTTYYRGQKLLSDFGQSVYSGPALKGINTWAFEFVIPHRPDLPPTYFQKGGHAAGSSVEWLYAEYFLQAEVVKQSSPRKPAIALFPIYVRYESTPLPITTFQPQTWAAEESVRTLHLETEYADKHLSLRQHMRTIFKPYAIPQFSFSLVTEYPTIVQLGQIRPISFRIHALPELGPEKTSGSLAEKPPSLTLVRAEIGLLAKTRYAALDGSSSKVTRESSTSWKDVGFFDWKPENPPAIPVGQNAGTIDIGSIIQLRVTCRGVSVSGGPLVLFEEPLWPSFNTDNLGVAHQLKWRLVVMCAGKKRQIKGVAPVTVLGPSEDQEQRTAGRAGEEDIARAYRLWHEKLPVGLAIAVVGGPAIWAAGEQVSSPPVYEA